MRRSKFRILVIDDDETVCHQLVAALGGAGLRVTCALNGLKMVSALKVERPDLVFLETDIRWLDSRQFVRALRHSADFHDVPIVTMGAAPPEWGNETAAAGRDPVFLPKPLDLDAALAAAKQTLRLDTGAM